MNRWKLNDKLREKVTPEVLVALQKIEESEKFVRIDITHTGLNPSQLFDLLEEMGYEKGDMETNGWQWDFWLHFTKDGCKPISVEGTGYIFELNITSVEG